EIAQSRAYERNHFVAARLGTDELRVGVKLQQLVLKRRELKEIVFFLDRFRGATANRAGVAGFGAVHIEFIRETVLAGVTSFVDESLIANAPEQFLHALLVAVFGGAD